MRLAQSNSQFKTRMNIRINTSNMHTPDDPTPTEKRRHTSRNNQCNPDMQWSNAWTMDTSHDYNQIQRAS